MSAFDRAVDRAIARENANPQGLPAADIAALDVPYVVVDDLYTQVVARLKAADVSVTPEQVHRVDEARRSSHQPPYGVIGGFIENALQAEEDSHG
jgi:hypothetical protein